MVKPKWSAHSRAQQRLYFAWWRETNRDKYNKGRLKWANDNRDRRSFQARKSHLKNQYNLTPEEFSNLIKKQTGKCGICKGDLTKTTKDKQGRIKIHCFIDHDHKTKKIRGILCFNCNVGIGHLKDSIRLLKNAITYLKKNGD